MDLLEGSAFRQFVLKIHSRCDLACDYCYVYTKVDQRWRTRPVVMPRDVVEKTAYRIGEHVRAHGLTSVSVVLHGGEPLLAGLTVTWLPCGTRGRDDRNTPAAVADLHRTRQGRWRTGGGALACIRLEQS
jgi:hypothetical protein